MPPKEYEDKLNKVRKAKGYPTVSKSEVLAHNKEKNCWIVIEGCVFDVTTYMHSHPGGKMAIIRHAGKDATQKFIARHATLPNAWNKLPDMYVADLGGGCLGCAVM